MDVVDTGTTAFMLCCIIGLTLMIPGLALFYGGMVSVKSSTNMMMMTFGAAVAIVGVLWVLFGFSMAFGTSYGGFVGSFTEFAGMKDLLESTDDDRGPAGQSVRVVPGAVRRDHRRADLRCGGRPDEVRRVDGLRRRVGRAGVLPRRALGVRLRRRGHRGLGRRLDRQQPEGHRLRRWHRGAHQRRRGRAGRRDRARQVRELGPAAQAAQRAADPARRGPAVGRLVRVQRRFGAGRGQLGGHRHGHHVRRDLRGHAGLARGREVQGRPRHRCRCRVGCHHRPGRHHPRLRCGDARRRDHRSARSPARSARTPSA